MAQIPGSIPVTGFIGPTDSNDTYAVTDALYGIDGLRSVTGVTQRNLISTERRREGMLVYTQNDNNFWQLLAPPWSGINADWKLFISSGTNLSSSANKYRVVSGETIDIGENYEYFVYGNLTLEGTINNSGKLIIMNGALINSGGTYNQISGGSLSLVSSQTINKFSLTTGLTANVPLLVTHNLGTIDVLVTVKDLNTNKKIIIDEGLYNLNDITIESTQTLSNIKITIIG